MTAYEGDFDEPNGEEQRARELRFDAALDPADLREWMKHLSARPHHVGSEWGEQIEVTATVMRQLNRKIQRATKILQGK